MKALVVDLDHSFYRTDLLFEAFLAFLKRNPLNIFRMIFWLLKGGPLGLKIALSESVPLSFENMPFRRSISEIIESKRRDGHRIVLASASPQLWVETVVNRTDIFHTALGSTTENLKGLKKHQAVSQLLGFDKYTYIGDSKSDLAIWKNCGNAILVNPQKSLEQQVRKVAQVEAVIQDRKSLIRQLLKQMRLHQWSKNVLIFLPMLAAHVLNLESAMSGLIAFFSFSFAASSVYIFNDLLDLDADRNHHTKKNRPLPSGDLKIRDALIFLCLLIPCSFALSLWASPYFGLVILLYWFMNLLYTFFLKREVILDIIMLSGMYTLRLFAGSVVTAVVLSQWLLSFSTLFFFCLACVKRHAELTLSQTKLTIDGRGYRRMDQSTVQILGIATGCLSILVVLLYLQSSAVSILYSNPGILWLLTPVFLYWVARLWVLAGRGQVQEDPVVFALRDKASWGCLVTILLILVFAK